MIDATHACPHCQELRDRVEFLEDSIRLAMQACDNNPQAYELLRDALEADDDPFGDEADGVVKSTKEPKP